MKLYEHTVFELKDLLSQGQTSAPEILESLLERIRQVDDKVKAFITLEEESARRQAKQGFKSESALSGVPYGLKDLFCTQGVKTTCASKMLADFVPTYDAAAASKLKQEDGILLGKLNMDEFAMGSSTEFSAFFPTHNPWDLSKVPGGSSGGSAAAVAAGEIPFALGTDTGGSIRQPAAFCGVVGLKPTYGCVSRWGVVAFASSLDQVGVFSKDVADCALIMNIIAGYDPLDSTSVNITKTDYTHYLRAEVKGLKIAYPKEYFLQGVDEDIKQLIKAALKQFEQWGAIVDEVSLPHSEYALPAYYLLAPAEASANLARFDGIRYGWRDLSAANVNEMFSNSRDQGFGSEVKRRIMLGTYALSSGYYDAYYLKALKVRQLISQDFERVFAEYDLIMSPTTPNIAFNIGENSDDPLTLYMNDILTVPVNMAGLPGISIPCGFLRGLPVGLQIIGKPFAEGQILQAAYTWQMYTDFHKQKPALGVS